LQKPKVGGDVDRVDIVDRVDRGDNVDKGD
jgi:hypothetical protein